MRSFRAGIAWIGLLVAATGTSAQEAPSADPEEMADRKAESPRDPPPARQWLVPAPHPPPKESGWLHLDQLGGYLEFEGGYEQQRRRRKTAGQRTLFGLREPELRQTNRDVYVRELLGIDVAGDIIHPYVFSFDGTISLGLEQTRFREEVNSFTQTDSDDGFISEFDLRGRFMQAGALNGEVYARRTDRRIPRRFIPALDEERTLYGVRFSLRSDIMPMQLSLEREHVDRDGGYDDYDDEKTRQTRLNYEADLLFTDFHTLHIEYEYVNLHEEIAGNSAEFRTRRHEWLLEDRIQFGDQRQHRLDTLLRYQQEDGDLARDILDFNPRLTLTHSDSLTGYLSYQFLDEQYDQSGFESHRADYTLVHQLYESLTSTVNVFGTHEDYDDDLRANTYGASLNETYRKKNDLGVFRAEVGYAWDQRKERGGEHGDIQIHESATFRDPLPVYLSEPHVLIPTIVVTDPQRTRVFLRGRDYHVTQFRGRVALTRIRGGNIADGDSVAVFYAFRRRTRSREDTNRFDARVEQQFDFGLRPYYEFNFRHQEISDPYTDVLYGFGFEEDDLTRHRVGADYTKDRWSVGIEFESEDNHYDPFDAIHLTGQVTLLQTNKMNSALSATYSRFYFDSPDNRDVDFLDITWDGRFDFSDRLGAQLATAYRWENDSVDGVTHGVDVEASLTYLVGRTQFELTGEYDLLEINGSPDDGMSVWLRIRRDLGNWLR